VFVVGEIFMPLPKPSPSSSGKEAQQKFMQKCMHAIKDEKRPQDQKVAICMDIWRRRKKSAKGSQEPEWDEENTIIKNDDGNCIIL
jgi:hypothetical protein